MVRWSDLGASMQACPRAMLRPDLWLEVLRRLFLSRVFAGYAALALALYFGGGMLQSVLAEGSALGGDAMVMLLGLLMVAGPLLPLFFALLVLPYAYWAFTPAAARVLPAYLDVPPAVEEEPRFRRYLLWTLPAAGVIVLAALLQLVPGVGTAELAAPLLAAAAVLVLLSLLKLFIRAALAAHYPPEDVHRFLAATRWQRLLLWLPGLALFGWGCDWLLQYLLAALDLHDGTHGTTPAGTALLVGLQSVVALLAAIVATGVLLLACGRLAGVAVDTATAIDSSLARREQATRPMTREQLNAMRDAHVARRLRPPRWLKAGTAMVVLASSLGLARMHLADWYFARDPLYAGAADGILGWQQQGDRKPRRLLDPAVREDRLRAGFIAYGCSGQLDRAQWIERIGATGAWDHGRVLACAACGRQQATVDWLLESRLELIVDLQVAPQKGGAPMSALACAARDNDLHLAQRLLQRAARERDFVAVGPALQTAAARQHWPMVRMLLQKDRTAGNAATFAALEAAHADQPGSPASLLPRMLEAGLAVHAVDRNGRSLFHWAALRHDLPLLLALLERTDPGATEAALRRPDHQGALPWVYVLRQAQVQQQPLSDQAAELLRRLLPPDADVNFVVTRERDGDPEALPAGWNAGAVALAQPLAREILGAGLDFGLLPQDPAAAWKFNSVEDAEDFVRGATPLQLHRAENPEAPAGGAVKKLSAALEEAGWPQLAQEVQAVVQGTRR